MNWITEHPSQTYDVRDDTDAETALSWYEAMSLPNKVMFWMEALDNYDDYQIESGGDAEEIISYINECLGDEKFNEIIFKEWRQL